MGQRRINGVDNPIERRVYTDSNLFDNIRGKDGKLKPITEKVNLLSDEELENEATITEDDILLAYSELDSSLLQSLFDADLL